MAISSTITICAKFLCPLALTRYIPGIQPHSGSRDDRRNFRDDRRKRSGLFRAGKAPSSLKFCHHRENASGLMLV